ncbi:hypothetical protein [Aestuariivirga sp.]|uniref:hypothetical protein n=1 Tax=Aestuariivirga sp. TaxID=2650926 RepID=UPI003BAA9434
MAIDDFEIARKILQGWTPQHQEGPVPQSLLPASFREIDGRELARQYATHRKIAGATGAPATQREPGSRLASWARDFHARMTRNDAGPRN